MAPAPRRGMKSGAFMLGGRYTKKDGMPQLVQDVYPSIRERVYGLEKDVETVQREFRDHREESIRHGERFATREHLTDLERSMTQNFTEVNRRLDKRVAWSIAQTAGLIVTMAYGLILSYKHFIQP